MSDEAQTIYRLGLALGCVWGAWFLKVGSGVSNDDKTSDVRNGVAGSDFLYRVPNRSLASGANPMKEQDEHRGQVIDFLAARDRIALRRWAVANGFVRLPMRPR